MFAQYSEFAKQFDMTKLFDTKKLPTQADLLKKSQEFTTSLLELNTYNAQSVIEATNKSRLDHFLQTRGVQTTSDVEYWTRVFERNEQDRHYHF